VAKRIVFSRKAYTDIDRIVEFNNLRNQSTVYSKKFVNGLYKRLLTLAAHPLSGVKTENEKFLLLVWDDYYIFYQPKETTIEIAAIYHQKEDVAR
jgi:plasmid stabilization system protein ParE